MTIITEHRLKCELCGHVSPVILEGETPHGWVRPIRGIGTPGNGSLISGIMQLDFCTPDHYEQWKRKNASSD